MASSYVGVSNVCGSVALSRAHVKHMPVLEDGSWMPRLTPRQLELFNLCRSKKHRYILACGPRLSGKTLGCLHCVVDHAWNTPNANICVVTVTQSSGVDSGVWTDLVDTVLPQWIDEGDFGMQWVQRPRISAVTKKPYCIVTNKFGHHVKIQMDSLDKEIDVERRYKSKRFSMMFVNELSNFRSAKAFRIWTECLRIVGLPSEDHLFLADTNPSDDGESSWIYKLWYQLPRLDLSKVQDEMTEEELRMSRLLQPMLGLVEFSIDDNTLVEKSRIDVLKASYASDPDLWARYVLGKWVSASADALFANVFRDHVHVVPQHQVTAGDEQELMVPEPDCQELITGWDPGVVNCAVVIVEKANVRVGDDLKPVFKVLDEVAVIGEDFRIEDFVYEVVQRMKFWESVIGRPVAWRHFADRYVFDTKEPAGNRYIHQIIYESCPYDTPGGPIALIAADRSQGSVGARVQLLRQLLFERRIFISRYRCPRTIKMLKSIKKGRGLTNPIDRASEHKHVFDALMYAIAPEAYQDIARSVAVRRSGRADASLITVSL